MWSPLKFSPIYERKVNKMKMEILDVGIEDLVKMDNIDNIICCVPYKHRVKDSKDNYSYGIQTKNLRVMNMQDIREFLKYEGFICRITES